MSVHRYSMTQSVPVTAPPTTTHFLPSYPPPPHRSHFADTSIDNAVPPPPPVAGPSRQRSESVNGPGKKPARKITRPNVPSRSSHSNSQSDAISPPSATATGRKAQSASAISQAAQGSSDSPPPVLVREKKQKACANCRKAKLKCMMDDGQTECVRCRSRKEKCIFYPRSHDEDWQQTMTTDVYAAITHMAQMSRAVHHILHHLTRERIIPPFKEDLEVFNPVERDMVALQGWNAEKNQDLPGRSRGPDKRKRAEDDDPSNRHHSFSTEHNVPLGQDRELRRPTLMSEPSDPTYPVFDFTSPEIQTRPSIPMLAHERSRPSLPAQHTELPPFQPLPPIPVHLTPTSELEMTQPDAPINIAPWSGKSSSSSSSQLPFPASNPSHISFPPPPLLGPGPTVPPPLPSPQNLQNATPASIPQSSPASLLARTPGDLSLMQSSSTRSDSAPINQSLEEALRNLPAPDLSQQIQTVDLDEDGDEVYGTADGRQTVISKGLVPARTAKILVQYFHSKISPHLFGYHLQLRRFPYLADGPRSITPFILAVECLLASERISELFSYHAALADEVLAMLMHSPAESWQTFESSKDKGANGNGTGKVKDHGDAEQAHSAPPGQTDGVDAVRLGPALEMVDENWDPELGIGPEEIVAVCALASFISQREEAKMIATYAFTWAKGWTKYIQAPRNTFAEMAGLVSALRMPTKQEMARVWLLSYIALGQEQIVDNSYKALDDPIDWCRAILPDLDHPSSACTADPHDIILVSHARLLAILFQWLKDRLEMPRRDDPKGNASALRRVSERTAQHLDWWAEDLRAYQLQPVWTQQIMLDWLHAKTLVSSVLFKNMWGGPQEDQIRETSRASAIDSAVQLLKRCISWNNPETISQLPNVYYRMIALAAGEATVVLLDVAQGTCSPMACPTNVDEMIQVMATLSQLLAKGGVQDGHYCRETARTLRQHVEHIGMLPH